jgi:hypothetical protein
LGAHFQVGLDSFFLRKAHLGAEYT